MGLSCRLGIARFLPANAPCSGKSFIGHACLVKMAKFYSSLVAEHQLIIQRSEV